MRMFKILKFWNKSERIVGRNNNDKLIQKHDICIKSTMTFCLCAIFDQNQKLMILEQPECILYLSFDEASAILKRQVWYLTKSNENYVPRQDNVPSLLFVKYFFPILARMQHKINAKK